MKFLILATLLGCWYLELVLAGENDSCCFMALFGRRHGKKNPSAPTAKDYLKDSLERLNEYLIENVQGADVKTNLAAVADLMSSSSFDNHGSPLFEALVQFAFIDTDDLCGEQTINTVNTLNIALDDPLTDSSGIPLKRIDSIVYQLGKKIFSECHHTFIKIVETKNQQMDPVMFGRVKTFVGDAYAEFLGTQKSLPSRVFYSPELILFDSHTMDMEHAKILYKEIIKLSKEDGDPLRKLVDERAGTYQKSKFKNLFEKYIVHPCEDHNHYLSRHLFEPIFDNKFPAYLKSKPEYKAYYMSFVRYRTCARLLDTIEEEKREDEWNTIFEKILTVAES